MKRAAEIERAHAWLARETDAMARAVRALVEQSSWTADKHGADEAGAILRDLLPLRCEVVASEAYGSHLVFHGTRPASEGGAVLIGHLDTVFPKERFDGYRVEGHIARGPGVLDMKGGLIVAAWALRALREIGALDTVPVSFVVVSDEEVGSPDSTVTVRRVAAGAHVALGFESGRPHDEIVTQRKGTGSFTVTATGKAAHAGNAHAEGANAIWSLARFVDRAQSLTDYARGVTVNIGTVHGGMGKNTVPDRAEVQGDLRFVTVADEQALRAQLERITADAAVPGTTLTLTWGPGRPPLERTVASAALRDAYGQAQRAVGLGDGEVPLQGGGSDAATTSSMGIPSIDGLGVRGLGYHTTDEWMDLASLAPKAEALVRYLLAARDARAGR